MYCCTPKVLYNHVGCLSSTTTSVQHPLGWCDGSHSTTAPVRSPHTSYRWRGERDRANQVYGDYWEAMIDKGQWREFGQDTGLHPTLYDECHGILMTTESQDLGLTSHPKDGTLFFFVINNLFLFFSYTTQHNIQNKTKQNSRHILNISRFNQKGGREGRTTRTQKLLL